MLQYFSHIASFRGSTALVSPVSFLSSQDLYNLRRKTFVLFKFFWFFSTKAIGYYPGINLYLKQSTGLNSAVIQAILHCLIVWLQQKQP
jgi:hypothetical protein